uniref:zinc finger protein 862-like n=1 Tax=Epinephelus lanceolatus TaxID=310571 RepID=UPI00144502E5|nr:zinc finger protein 862-like [Epinephelus lanceolatus]
MEQVAASQSSSAEVQGRAKKGMTLKGDVIILTHPQLKHHVEAAVNISVDAIKARFGGLVKDDAIHTTLDCFRVLNPDTWPEEPANLLTFGDDSVEELLGHFEKPLTGARCNTAAVQDEWRQLKVLVSQNFRDKTNTGLWQMLLMKDPYKQEFKNILELVKIMLVLPISAAQCERGFSAQNWIKNSTRSSLAVSTTEDLMRISLEGPSVEEFDPTPAVDCWLTSKRTRRPDYKSCWDDILCV